MKNIVILNLMIINLLFGGETHRIYLGQSYKVVEKDLLEMIHEHIEDNKVMIEGKLKNMSDESKDKIDNMKNDFSLPFATNDEVVKDDLKYVLTDNDVAPNVPKGSVIYPLKHTSIPYAIYLINGGEKKEIEWLKKQEYRNIKSRVWVVNGNLKELKDDLKVPIFFYNEKIQTRFKVKGTPVKIYQQGETMIFEYHRIERL